MRIENYTTVVERDALIAAAEAQGETMLHDDHHVNGPGNHQLTFGIIPDEPAAIATIVEILEAFILANPAQVTPQHLIELEIARLTERRGF